MKGHRLQKLRESWMRAERRRPKPVFAATDFEKAVGRGSPIPPDYTQAHPFLLEAEDLEKNNGTSEQIQSVLRNAKAADPEAHRYYASRKAIQRAYREDLDGPEL